MTNNLSPIKLSEEMHTFLQDPHVRHLLRTDVPKAMELLKSKGIKMPDYLDFQVTENTATTTYIPVMDINTASMLTQEQLSIFNAAGSAGGGDDTGGGASCLGTVGCASTAFTASTLLTTCAGTLSSASSASTAGSADP